MIVLDNHDNKSLLCAVNTLIRKSQKSSIFNMI